MLILHFCCTLTIFSSSLPLFLSSFPSLPYSVSVLYSISEAVLIPSASAFFILSALPQKARFLGRGGATERLNLHGKFISRDLLRRKICYKTYFFFCVYNKKVVSLQPQTVESIQFAPSLGCFLVRFPCLCPRVRVLK